MAKTGRRPAKSRRPNRRSNIRSNLRHLNRAVNQIPVLVRPPADPPSIKPTREFTVSKDIRIFYDAGVFATSYNYTGYNKESFIVVGKSLHYNFTKIKLDQSDLFQLWQSGMGMAINKSQAASYEIALVSCKVWGPSPSASAREVALRVRFSNGESYLYANDSGDGKSRARVGVHFPFRIFISASTANQTTLSKDLPDTSKVRALLNASYTMVDIELDNTFLVSKGTGTANDQPYQHPNGIMVGVIYVTVVGRRYDLMDE